MKNTNLFVKHTTYPNSNFVKRKNNISRATKTQKRKHYILVFDRFLLKHTLALLLFRLYSGFATFIFKKIQYL
jgi:hypothetical protein